MTKLSMFKFYTFLNLKLVFLFGMTLSGVTFTGLSNPALNPVPSSNWKARFLSSKNIAKTSYNPVDQVLKWNNLLAKHVRLNGGVDYTGFKKDIDELKAFIDQYKFFSPDKMSENSKKAHYLNLYNSTMILHLLKYAEMNKIKVNSSEFLGLKINKLKVPGGDIWDGDLKVNLGGEEVNLDNIEHDLIRLEAKSSALSRFKLKSLDPRIHTAVNCAASSCPRVREVAFSGDNVDELLDKSMREYLNSDIQFKKIDNSTMQMNSIVFWYYADFDNHAKNVLKQRGAGDYLSTFIQDTKDKDWKIKHLRSNFNDRSKFSLKFSSAFDFEYDWKVNDIRNMQSLN